MATPVSGWVLQGIPLPAWDEVRGTPARRIKGKYDGLQQHRAIVCSITDWLDKIGIANFGKTQWQRELDALNTQASVVLRVNRLQTNPKTLQNELVAEESNGFASNLSRCAHPARTSQCI